ncbi:MAG: hypothetical protein JXN65_10005 [Clostridia bacterium]|nr:hypothetical protein [Clostridia bacterium]
MRKTFKIIKIVLAVLFILAFIFLAVNLVKIRSGHSKIAAATGESAKYYTDDYYLNKKYYKYKDENGTEYWIDAFAGRFSYMYDASAADSEKGLTLEKARQAAYSEAAIWDSAFFQSDTMWEVVDGSNYEFIIFQLDSDGMRNGRFITVSVPADKVGNIQMHTRPSKNAQVSSSISEKEALSKAYSQTEDTEFALYEKDGHLAKCLFIYDGQKWLWEISIWKITGSAIESMSEAIDRDVYFSCTIDAFSGKVIDSGWVG